MVPGLELDAEVELDAAEEEEAEPVVEDIWVEELEVVEVLDVGPWLSARRPPTAAKTMRTSTTTITADRPTARRLPR
jgi:hypothetical protein